MEFGIRGGGRQGAMGAREHDPGTLDVIEDWFTHLNVPGKRRSGQQKRDDYKPPESDQLFSCPAGGALA
jgi:hypothetical protein